MKSQPPSHPHITAHEVKRHFWSFLINRMTISIVLMLIQFAAIVVLLLKLEEYSGFVYLTGELFSAVVIIWLVRKEDNPSYKITWIIIILILPYLGTAFYLIWGNTPLNRARVRQIPSIRSFLPEDPAGTANETLCKEHPRFRRTCTYLNNVGEMPVWENTSTKFYPSGYELLTAMTEDMKKAEKFIFLEYFIIEPGIVWDSMLAVLARKVSEGVDVRVMYDDVGCLGTLPLNYDKTLRRLGIQVVKFNPFLPLLRSYLNFRSHQKICIIDGNVGFTGGANLADEYANYVVRFGHWKDTGVRLCGDGVTNLTAQFLQMWDYATQTRTMDFSRYLPTVSCESDGYVQAFSDSPLDRDNVSENVYMNIISTATDYVYITSPYLTLDNEMITALCTAAQSGIDVRIVTPGIPDKSYVYAVTRSYYAQLTRAGVRIYEYTPGFLHAKMVVSDDSIAIVGTINMDFRSFYLHFENGSVFYHSSVVREIKDDILKTIDSSRAIDEQWLSRRSHIGSVLASLLRLFAPLM